MNDRDIVVRSAIGRYFSNGKYLSVPEIKTIGIFKVIAVYSECQRGVTRLRAWHSIIPLPPLSVIAMIEHYTR